MTIVYWPDFYTEAHRSREDGQRLAFLLSERGFSCRPTCPPGFTPDLVFCGSIFKLEDLRRAGVDRKVPVVHYNWDLYPAMIAGEGKTNLLPWRDYIAALNDPGRTRLILVPSRSVADRTWEYAGRRSTVCLASVRPWQPPEPRPAGLPAPGSYAVDALRRYAWDRNEAVVREACQDLGIPLVETACRRPWDEYRALVHGARFLVAGYEEMSTGGLSLLEGYYHGVPVLTSNSPRNGALDYFGDRAHTFVWDDPADLRRALGTLWRATGVERGADLRPADNRAWVELHYSDAAFAGRLAAAFREATLHA